MPRKSNKNKEKDIVKEEDNINNEDVKIKSLDDAEKPRKSSGKTEKKTLLQSQQTNGKLYNKYGVKSIDEILDGKIQSKYFTDDEKIYANYLDKMNTSDLQTHSASLGIMFNQDRGIVIKRLMKEFKMQNSMRENPPQYNNAFSKPISQEVLDILSEGR